MFTEETVFILGAGASWHYGYPTGSDLIKKIKNALQLFENKKFLFDNQIIKAANEVQELASKISLVNPLSIDFFLSTNFTLGELGKFFISLCLLDDYKENTTRYNQNIHSNHKIKNLQVRSYTRGNNDDKDRWDAFDELQKIENEFDNEHDWLKFIIAKLCQLPTNAKLTDNRITFITFNYENSLEKRILKALKTTETVSNEYKDFFNADRFIHVYGSLLGIDEILNDNPYPLDFSLPYEKGETYLFAKKCYQNIKLIDSREQIKNEKLIKEKLKAAKTIYILGYGFDEANNNILDLDEIFKSENKKIYFTNFNDHNKINKVVGKSLNNTNSAENTEQYFVKNSTFKLGSAETRAYFPTPVWHLPSCNLPRQTYIEKSTKNVYRALAEDFDL